MSQEASVGDGRKTVLVVDDSPEEIAVLDGILKKDYRVKAATSGTQAIAIARADPQPDLLLLDVSMPDMDGFEVCRILKEDAAGSAIPVIFLTGKSLASDEKIGLEVGAVDYIRKPVDPDIVRGRIGAQLASKERALRASELRYRRLFESSLDGILLVDARSGAIVDANPALASLLGLSQEYFLGRQLSDLAMLADILPLGPGIAPAERPSFLRHADRPMSTADGRRLFVESSCGTYRVDGREIVQLGLRDISGLVLAERERARTFELLSASLREKEALLQEIHHRVMNNMQIIISLLHVSMRGVADEALRDKIDDITERLYSMAAIHEQFYGSADASRIDFALYLRQLVDSPRGGDSAPPDALELDCGPGEALLTLEQAIPAGLVVSEFLTLAAKSGGGAAALRQRVAEDGFLELSLDAAAVAGSYAGVPEPDAGDDGEEPLGLMLVHALTSQLGAELEMRREGGFSASLRFRIAETPPPMGAR